MMKIINSYIVYDYQQWLQQLVECENDIWYMTSTGAFGQLAMRWEPVTPSDARRLIK